MFSPLFRLQIYEEDLEFYPSGPPHTLSNVLDSEPLFYNSRPLSRASSTYDPTTTTTTQGQNIHPYQQTNHHHQDVSVGNGYGSASSARKRSLERQTTLYEDDTYNDEDDEEVEEEEDDEEPLDHVGYYDQDGGSEDHRHWDLGGRGTSMTKILPPIPIRHSGSCNEELIFSNHQPQPQQQPYHHHQPYVGCYGGGAIQLPTTPMSAALLATATPVGPKKQRLLPQPLKPNPVPVHPRLLPQMPSPTPLRHIGDNDDDFYHEVGLDQCSVLFLLNAL